MSDVRVQESYALERMGIALDRMHNACTDAARKQAAKWAIAWAMLSESQAELPESPGNPPTLTSALKKYIESSFNKG